jgi:hypothetical protein
LTKVYNYLYNKRVQDLTLSLQMLVFSKWPEACLSPGAGFFFGFLLGFYLGKPPFWG